MYKCGVNCFARLLLHHKVECSITRDVKTIWKVFISGTTYNVWCFIKDYSKLFFSTCSSSLNFIFTQTIRVKPYIVSVFMKELNGCIILPSVIIYDFNFCFVVFDLGICIKCLQYA